MDEFNVEVAPSIGSKKYNVFKLHKDDNVTWTEAKMRRDNDYQPWQIKTGSGRTSRRYKAIKEGGVCENASYFIFYKPVGKKNTYEVCPIEEWYNVSATQRYKTLTAEEAEQKFEQRHKMLNLFSVMVKKNGEDGEEVESNQAFKVSEMDDWDQSGDEEADDEDTDKKVNRKKAIKEEDVPDEGKEESEDGDFEQKEVDYMSDSSDELSEPEVDVKGVAEEMASSSDEEDEENLQQKESKNITAPTAVAEDSGSESSDSDDYDVDEVKLDSLFMKKILPAQLSIKPEVPTTSAPKRKATTEAPAPAKRPCPTEPSSAEERIVEDLIRKYLTRKPTTLRTLLKDIKNKSKKMGCATPRLDNDLVGTVASIIKRIEPDKQKINDVTYLYFKS